MKTYVVKSDYSEVPLAEVRESNGVIDFVVDNTAGRLPSTVGRSLEALHKYVRNSSHIRLEEPKAATVNLLRYVMDNGDVVEMTSDGHTVILNGHMLDQGEKDALFNAFRRGEIKVSRKTDPSQAIPLVPARPPVIRPKMKLRTSPLVLDMIDAEQKKRDDSRRVASADYDPEIDDASYDGSEDSDWTREMARWLRYGR